MKWLSLRGRDHIAVLCDLLNAARQHGQSPLPNFPQLWCPMGGCVHCSGLCFSLTASPGVELGS